MFVSISLGITLPSFRILFRGQERLILFEDDKELESCLKVIPSA